MRMTYVVHILAGTFGLLVGYIALYAAKGGRLHRKTGRLFVYAMLTTAVFGFLIAAIRGVAPAVNVPASLLTGYLVITSLTTLRPPATGARWLSLAALVVVLVVTFSSLTFAVEAFANGGKRNGIPAFPFVMFGVVGLLASVGDVRLLRAGAGVLQGASRVARHLWRMTFALFIAALSFFIGQAQVIPKPIRIPGLLALPVLAVLVTMFYWLWRVRVRRSLRGLAVSTA
jgi:uncharacterized membrane protein